MKHQDLTKDSITKLFFRYLFPSISATLVTSIYILVDTIIIGKGIGEDAVAALNIVLPLFNLYFGSGLLFGVGGSVLFSVSKGQENQEKANQYFSITALGAFSIMLFYLLVCNIYFEPLMKFLGMTEQTRSYVTAYAPFVTWGIPVYVASSFLQTFVRNDKNPTLSMIAVITGGVLNIFLDILFVFNFNMGMAGASLASTLGVLVTCLILLSHFFTKKNTIQFTLKGLHLGMLWSASLTGFSSFLIEICGGIVILSFNTQLLKYTGVIGVTAYSIISNTALMVTSLGNGISQAAQPIIATNYGAAQISRVQKTMRLGLLVTSGLGLAFFLFSMFFPKVLVYVYINPTEEILPLAIQAIRLYAFAFFGMSINAYLSNYFQAILKPYHSLGISLLRGLILNLSFVYLLPLFLGVIGIWIAIPLVEVFTLVISITLVLRTKLQLN